jgi:hypothetical protein
MAADRLVGESAVGYSPPHDLKSCGTVRSIACGSPGSLSAESSSKCHECPMTDPVVARMALLPVGSRPGQRCLVPIWSGRRAVVMRWTARGVLKVVGA